MQIKNSLHVFLAAMVGAAVLAGSSSNGSAQTRLKARISAVPSSIITGGQPVNLTWSSTKARSCTGTNLSTGGLTSGSATVYPNATTTYSVICADLFRTVSAMIIVRVGVEMRPVPDPLYGVTVDDVTKLTDIAQSLQNLSHFPTTRVVFDPGMTPTDYSAAITAMLPYSYIVGQPVDSSEFTQYTTQQYHDRFAQYLSSSLADQVDIWEVGNEVNGNWLGSYQSVNDKIYDAWKQVNTAGKRSMLTLWYNPNCAGSGEIDLIAFSQQYVPNDMRNGLDYITISCYETQCNNYRPSAEALTSLFDQLHALYPNSKLVFGEVGLPSPVRKSTYNTAVSIINYYYALKITTPGYVGGYLWWNYVEDMVPYSIQPLWTVLDAALQTIQIPCAEAGC